MFSVTDDLGLLRNEASTDYEGKTVSEVKADPGLGEAVLIAFVLDGKVANSSTKLTGHNGLDLQERRRVVKLSCTLFRWKKKGEPPE
ncbi:hypothetical protein N018_11855 [Pseudomonas syringae CC1557]|uniref:Uncharacterized protein n=1 Tax=Pseudomonas syringae CC1557 TaxID=1357279 RepID=W0N3D8_PSESX|nr:hypothetical protein N018_11855 [Pseudomonas syringae CC1557]